MKRQNKILLVLLATFLVVSCSTDQDLMDADTVNHADQTVSASKNAVLIPGQYVVVLKDGILASNGLGVSKSTTEDRLSYQRKNIALLNQMKSNDQGLQLGIDNRKISNVFGYALEGFVVKNLTEAEVALLKKDSRVKSIDQDYRISLEKPSSLENVQAAKVTDEQETPWGITRVGGAGDGTGKTAWVIDSGIDLDHPDLNVDQQRSVSFMGDNNPDDENGHGTHVAGTIAAINNNIGVVGVAAGASVVALKVVGSDGKGDFSTVVSALDYVYANGSVNDVVNMSISSGIRNRHAAAEAAVLKVAQKGIRLAIGAGNYYDDADYYSPAGVNHENVYTISAIAKGDFWAHFSNYGSSVDYAAPGFEVKSTWLNGGYYTANGTSMATPHAAGVLLLGNPKSDGVVKAAYWERRTGYWIFFLGKYTGQYSETNIFSDGADYLFDKDDQKDPIIHR